MSEAHRAFIRLEEERLLGGLDRSDNSSIKGDRQEKKNTANKSSSGKNNTKKPALEKKFKDVTEFLRYRERQKKIKLRNTNLLSNDRERVIVAAKEEETGSIISS